MLLQTPLLTTLLAALVVLGITYSLNTLLNIRIAQVRQQRGKAQTENAESFPMASEIF